MEITTKFNVGQEVFSIQKNSIKCSPVMSIQVNVSNGSTRISYNLGAYPELGPECIDVPEIHVFASKEELINSL